jgi:hypothetical protein
MLINVLKLEKKIKKSLLLLFQGGNLKKRKMNVNIRS